MAGLRARNVLASWWAKRWLDALSMLAPRKPSRGHGYGGSDSRGWESGFTLARSGRVLEASLEGSVAHAHVVPEQRFPGEGRCTIAVQPFGDETWGRILPRLAARSQLEATLLSGDVPLQIEASFASAGVSLFPKKPDDLRVRCQGLTCGDGLCQHVAALHYLLADFIERDPFLLFELRGRPRARLLAELHASRRGKPPQLRTGRGLPLLGLLDGGYDALRAELPAPPRLPALPERVIESMKAPAGWTELAPPAQLLGSLIRDAAARATEAAAPPASAPRAPARRHRHLSDDPSIQRAQQLTLREPALGPVLPALVAVALGLAAARGEPAPELLEAFGALQPAGAPDLDAWAELWARAQLQRTDDVVLALGEVRVGARTAAVLWRLGAAASWPVGWWCEPERPEERIRQRLRALEALDERVPADRTVTLVGKLDSSAGRLLAFLDILGWYSVLRCSPDEPIAPPGREAYPLAQWLPPGATHYEWLGASIPRLDLCAERLVLGRARDGSAGGILSDRDDLSAADLLALEPPHTSAPDVFGLGVASARKASVGSTQMPRWLSLQAVTLGLLDLLGQAAGGPAGAMPWRRGLEALEALPTSDEARATEWLREAARKLAATPLLARLFWPPRHEPPA